MQLKICGNVNVALPVSKIDIHGLFVGCSGVEQVGGNLLDSEIPSGDTMLLKVSESSEFLCCNLTSKWDTRPPQLKSASKLFQRTDLTTSSKS